MVQADMIVGESSTFQCEKCLALPTIRVHPELDGPMLDIVHSLNSPVKICPNLNRVRCLRLSHNCDNEIDSVQITSVCKAELTLYESL